jgi:DNA-binding MarR family transcriptional regulator
MVRFIDELGMIRRVPDPDDRRQVLLHVSDAGNVTLDAERDRRDAWLHRRLEELTDEDREVLGSAAVVLERLGQA